MLVIGIVGGIASGKSTVTGLLQELGAAVLDADKTGHLVLQEPEVVRQLTQRWGDRILTTTGTIDRPAVAAIVFGAAPQADAELRFLESVTHPRIGERLQRQIERLQDQDQDDQNPADQKQRPPALVLDAPVLIKAGWDRLCDHILFVDASLETRWRRARQRGWSKKQFESRETSQTPIEIKRQRADVVIPNDGSLQETTTSIRRFWQSHIGDPSPPR